MTEIVPFEEREINTATLQVYLPFDIDIQKMFNDSELDEEFIQENFTYKLNKKGFIDKSTLKGPDNVIFSLRFFNEYKGLDWRKRVFIKNEFDDNEVIKFKNFRNQITIDFLLDGKSKNVMLFRGNFKIAGAKNKSHIQHITNLVMKFIHDYKNRVNDIQTFIDYENEMKNQPIENFKWGSTITITMKKYEFNFDFKINKDKMEEILLKEQKILEQVTNEDKFLFEFMRDDTSMKITFSYKQLDDTYERLIYPEFFTSDNFVNGHVVHSTINPKKKTPKNEKVDENKCTVIIFASSEIFLSGKKNIYNKKTYDYICKIITENKNYIRERTNDEIEKIDFVNKYVVPFINNS